MPLKLGHTLSTAGTFRKKFRKNSGKTPETLSERFLEFPSRVRLGCPKPYNSRHLRRPEHFQNSLPPSAAGDASFLRISSGEGLSELVMEFPAVLGAFLKNMPYDGGLHGIKIPCPSANEWVSTDFYGIQAPTFVGNGRRVLFRERELTDFPEGPTIKKI